MALDCLNSLVGLSVINHDCFTDEQPDGFDTSDSGYYLTDPDFGVAIAESCAMDGWTLLGQSRAQAIRELQTDLRALLRTKYDSALSPFTGLIGKKTFSGVTSPGKDFIGLRVRVPRRQKGLKLVVKQAFVGLNTSGDYSINIQSNDPEFEAPTPVTVSAVANTMTAATLNVELPFWSITDWDYGDYLEYYISIDRAGAKPVNNTLSCCGTVPGWKQFCEVDGMQADGSDGTGGTFTNAAQGFVLNAYLACEELDWICELEELNGYYLRDVLARCIQQRGAAVFIASLVENIQINPCTGYQLEALQTRRNYLNGRYSENTKWVVESLPRGLTDCFVCKPEKLFHRTKILV